MNKKLLLIGLAIIVIFAGVLSLFVVLNSRSTSTNDSSSTGNFFQNTFGRKQNQSSSQDNSNVAKSPEDIYSKPFDEGYKYLDEVHRVEYPDVYLANRVPFESDSFSIDQVLVKEGNGYYKFIVTPKNDEATARADLNTWLLSQNLTQDQINSLVFEFTTQ